MRLYNAYAGPAIWGQWVNIASHAGVANFSITADAVGSTLIRCRVRYYKTATQQVVEEWLDKTHIDCGDCYANVEVSFMGLPTGTAVDGTVNP